jgi:hypothetical protein
MRQTISGLVAAIAVVAASAAPAMACGGGLFQGSCSPCGQSYVSPCAQSYVPAPPPAPVYSGCNSCGGWAYERLPDPVREYSTAEPVHQYYYADQGPTYTGPGNFAPYPTYREGGWGYRHYHHHYGYAHTYRYHYGYAPHRGYAPRFYATHHRSLRYGAPMGMPRAYGHREMHEHTMRRYN